MQQPAEGGATGSESASDAKQLGNSAANRIHSELDSRKSDAADQVRSVSTAIQNTAGGLDANAPSWLKSAFQQGAHQVQRFADALEHKDSRQLVNEVQDFARERTALFLGACAAAGFAAARIFKAGADQQSGGSQGQQFGAGQPSRQRFGSEQQPNGQEFGSQGTQRLSAGNQRSAERSVSDADSTSRTANVPSSGEFAR